MKCDIRKLILFAGLCYIIEVLKLGSSARINEGCLELQKNKVNKATKVKVQHLHSHHNNYYKPIEIPLTQFYIKYVPYKDLVGLVR